MRNFKILYILCVLIPSLTVEGAIDPKDSTVVRTILDKIGWESVPVENVVRLSVSISTSAETQRVTILDLSYRENLPKIDILPSEIGKLPELNALILKGNNLKELPLTFSTLYKLIELDLSFNQFLLFPSSLQGLGLRIVNFNHNLLENIPEWIDTLKELQSISLSGNKIKDIPLQIIELKKLNTLNLDSNLLSSLPNSIIKSDIKIGIHWNRLCNVDSSLIEWLDSHSIKPNWLASQVCNEKYVVSSVVADVTTGTVVHISTEKINSTNCNPIEINNIDFSTLPWFSQQKILKGVEIKFSSCFVPVSTNFLITFTLDEERILDTVTRFSIYYIDSSYEIKYLGGNISKEDKTISVTANMEGKYLLVKDEAKTNAREKHRKIELSPEVKVMGNKNYLEVKFNQEISLPIEISIFLLNGRCVYKRWWHMVENNRVKIEMREINLASPGIMNIRNNKILLQKYLLNIRP